MNTVRVLLVLLSSGTIIVLESSISTYIRRFHVCNPHRENRVVKARASLIGTQATMNCGNSFFEMLQNNKNILAAIKSYCISLQLNMPQVTGKPTNQLGYFGTLMADMEKMCRVLYKLGALKKTAEVLLKNHASAEAYCTSGFQAMACMKRHLDTSLLEDANYLLAANVWFINKFL